MSFRSPETSGPEEVNIRILVDPVQNDRIVSVECTHHNLSLGCSKPDEVSQTEHIRQALAEHCHHSGCRCSASCWSDWHYGLDWPEARHRPCTPERN